MTKGRVGFEVFALLVLSAWLMVGCDKPSNADFAGGGSGGLAGEGGDGGKGGNGGVGGDGGTGRDGGDICERWLKSGPPGKGGAGGSPYEEEMACVDNCCSD